MKEKRRIQRVKLSRPISGAISGSKVELVDLSAVGVRIRHQAPLAIGGPVKLVFPFNNEPITVECDVVRSARDAGAFQSALVVADPKGTSGGALRRVVTGLLTRFLEQRRPARPKRA